jgi:outer membrane cobalamin receptor
MWGCSPLHLSQLQGREAPIDLEVLNPMAWTPAIGVKVLCAAVLSCRAAFAVQAQDRGSRAEFQPLKSADHAPAATRAVVSVRFARAPVQDVLREIARQAGLGISFRADLPQLDRRVSLDVQDVPAAEALLQAIGEGGLELLVASHGRSVIVRAAAATRNTDACAVGGIVRDAETGNPLAGVDVRLSAGAARTLTNAEGSFCFARVAAGRYTLEAGRFGFASARVEAIVVPGAAAEQLAITLVPRAIPLNDIVVTPGRFGIAHESVNRPETLKREQIETLPQLAEDIYRTVNRLPGIVSNEMTARFYVRGGDDKSMLVLLDGLELIEPFHLKDFDSPLSILDVAAIGGVDLTTGGFSAEYGNRLTGVFDLRSTSQLYTRPRTAIGLSLSNARIMSQGSFAGGNGLWLLSARRGYLDILLDLIGESDNLDPRYYDALGKVIYQFSPKHRVSAHFLRAGDAAHLSDEVSRADTASLDGKYGSTYAWLNWHADFGRLQATTHLSASALDWHRVGGFQGDSGRICLVCEVRDDFGLRDVRELSVLSARQDWRASISERFALKWGFELKRGRATYDYFRWVARDSIAAGQIILDQDTSTIALRPAGTDFGVYIAQRIRPWQPLTLETGIRWDRQSHTDEDQFSVRVNLALALDAHTTLRAAWGRYAQPHALYQLQVQDGEQRFSPAERAVQIVAGLERQLGHGILARLEAYRRDESELRPRFRNLSNVIEPVAEVQSDRRLFEPETGRAQGIELLVQRHAAASSWSASYALARAYDVIAGHRFNRQADQRHTLYLDYSIAPSPAWRLSASWQYHSGWPITPTTFRGEPLANGGVYIVRDYGDHYADRLAAYHRMDLRATRSFALKRGRLAVFLDIFNVYDHDNPQYYNYNFSYSQGRIDVARLIEPLLPRLPTLGASWEF